MKDKTFCFYSGVGRGYLSMKEKVDPQRLENRGEDLSFRTLNCQLMDPLRAFSACLGSGIFLSVPEYYYLSK